MLSFTLTPIWSCSGWRSKRNRRDICHLSRTRHFKLQWSRGPGRPQHTLHHQIILCICSFFLFLFLIARWLEPPCFFLPSARSTTRQTLRFLRGGSNPLSLDNFHSGVIRVLRQLGHLFATLFFFPLSLGPLLVGLVVVNIGICFGHNAGWALCFSVHFYLCLGIQ